MENPLIELLKALGMPDAQEIRDGMGPIHKAYDKVLEDRNPLATLTRFSLDEGASKELRPIVDFTLISTDGQGFQPETKLLAICMAGFFTGLQLADDRTTRRFTVSPDGETRDTAHGV